MICIACVGVFLTLLTLLHALKPELQPSWRFVSEYSIGRHGWVMKLGFFVWALSCLALFVSFRDEVITRQGRVGRLVLFAVGVSLVAAGVFAQDPLTASPEEVTTHGTLHAVASMIGIPGIPIAAWLIGRSLTRHNTAWHGHRRVVMGAAHLTWLSLVAMVAYLVVAVPQAGGFGPSVLAGWMNRLVVLAYCLWEIAVSCCVLSLNAQRLNTSP
jgi:amino acid permease